MCRNRINFSTSIVAAGIEALIQKQSRFIFATHLHELIQYVSTDKINISHLHVDFDPVTQKIIYDRKMKPGNGSSIYGLEVCAFLKLPETFLKTAEKIRKSVQGLSHHILPPKPSKYDPNTFLSTCELCGIHPATETHHIKHQKHADPYGYIDHIHKDHPSNLIAICESCHHKQHSQSTPITTKVLTSKGIDFQTTPLQPDPVPDLDNIVKHHLLYQIQGWYYRYDSSKPWRKLTSKNQKTVFSKLKLPADDIPTFLSNYQTVI